MIQTKLQDKTPERGLNEMEVTDLPDKNFKAKFINMLTDLWKVSKISGRTSTKK